MPVHHAIPFRLAAAAALNLSLWLPAPAGKAAEHEASAPAPAAAAAPKPAAAPAAKAEAKPDAKAEAKAETKPEAKANAKAEAKVDAKVDAKPAAADAKPAVRDEAKAEPRPAAPRDPLDILSEKLAARMAHPKIPPNDMVRVASKASTTTATRLPPPIVIGPRPYTIAPIRRREKPAPPPHWSYDGEEGPDAWSDLTPEFARCSTGARQSPIDIRDGIRVSLDPVLFDYKPTAFRVLDNGHTIQVNLGQGNSIEVLGHRYDLVQFHFHRPSEERVNGKQYDMVAHLVHKDIDGRLAVIAVLLERGGAQPIVQAVWNNLPLEKGEEQVARAPLDLNVLLPAERGYFTYMGSLTTPPCSEGVLWMVMKNPVPISPDQIGIFARLYPMNARPIQSAGGRLIKESN